MYIWNHFEKLSKLTTLENELSQIILKSNFKRFLKVFHIWMEVNSKYLPILFHINDEAIFSTHIFTDVENVKPYIII